MEMFQDQQLPFSNINIQYKINLFKFKHILFANITNRIKHKSYKLMMSFYYNIFTFNMFHEKTQDYRNRDLPVVF